MYVRQVLHVQKVLPSVQEVVTQLYKKIIYELDHIFLDIEYDIIMASRNIKMGKASWTYNNVPLNALNDIPSGMCNELKKISNASAATKFVVHDL